MPVFNILIAPLLSALGASTCVMAFVLGLLVAYAQSRKPILVGWLVTNFVLLLGGATLSLRAALPTASISPMGLFIAMVDQPIRYWIYGYAVWQPALLLCNGLGVALGVALFAQTAAITDAAPIPRTRNRCQVLVVRLLMGIAGIVLTISHIAILHTKASKPLAFQPPIILRNDLFNLGAIEMTHFTSSLRVASVETEGGKPRETITTIDGECTLSETSLGALLEDYDWRHYQADGLPDARWLGLPKAALKHESLLVSDRFDQTFAGNGTFTQGMAAIDKGSRTLYFLATDRLAEPTATGD